MDCLAIPIKCTRAQRQPQRSHPHRYTYTPHRVQVRKTPPCPTENYTQAHTELHTQKYTCTVRCTHRQSPTQVHREGFAIRHVPRSSCIHTRTYREVDTQKHTHRHTQPSELRASQVIRSWLSPSSTVKQHSLLPRNSFQKIFHVHYFT